MKSENDGARYRFIRALALAGNLEAAVALTQLDFLGGLAERFDSEIDELMKASADSPGRAGYLDEINHVAATLIELVRKKAPVKGDDFDGRIRSICDDLLDAADVERRGNCPLCGA